MDSRGHAVSCEFMNPEILWNGCRIGMVHFLCRKDRDPKDRAAEPYGLFREQLDYPRRSVIGGG